MYVLLVMYECKEIWRLIILKVENKQMWKLN